jgi:hypothetical protein
MALLQYITIKKRKFIAILSISFIICFSTNALSQPSFPDNTLVLGIRTISAPVTGYCEAFRDTLREQINKEIKITSTAILNQYKGENYSRYRGLLKDRFSSSHVDIECGPNSESSGKLENPDTKKPFSENIRFIRFHYPTGIKLLLKKEDAEKLSNVSSRIEYEKKISELKIGVLENTSTIKQFENNDDFYNYVPINSNNSTNALERVLSALDDDDILDNDLKIDAFASDDLILQSIVKEGIKTPKEDKQEGKLYVGTRDPYEKIGYVVFPSEQYPPFDQNDQYLPRLDAENYAIAIKKGPPNESWLSEKIQNSLNTSEKPDSKLNRAKRNLINPYPEIVDDPPQPSPSDESEDKSTSPQPPTPSFDKWWIPILIASIPAIASIIVAILRPEFLILIGNWIIRRRRQTDSSVSKSINGRVLDERNNPIYGARVSLEIPGNPLTTSTDTTGIFEFNFNTSNNRIMLRAEKEGYQAREHLTNTSDFQSILRIILPQNNE